VQGGLFWVVFLWTICRPAPLPQSTWIDIFVIDIRWNVKAMGRIVIDIFVDMVVCAADDALPVNRLTTRLQSSTPTLAPSRAALIHLWDV
jgi:hypothetical protein